MNNQSRFSAKLFAAILIALGLIATVALGQGDCTGQAPPADNLYLISGRAMHSLDLSDSDLTLIHDYGASRLVRHIVENHQGTVVIWNNVPGPGCTAEVRIPFADAAHGSDIA